MLNDIGFFLVVILWFIVFIGLPMYCSYWSYCFFMNRKKNALAIIVPCIIGLVALIAIMIFLHVLKDMSHSENTPAP
jgi:hypothetical protein